MLNLKTATASLIFAFSATAFAIDATTFKRDTDPVPGMEGEVLGPSLYSHEEIYLIGGGKPEFDLKFQVSFKARIFDSTYVGYTQLNAWDISKSSSPFRDTTHKLSLIYYPARRVSVTNNLKVHLSGGYEHNSNGRDSDASRSIDMFYVRPRLTYGTEESRHWRVTPKLFHYVRMSDNNFDIARYREILELEVANLETSSWAAALVARTGRNGISSTQLDVSQSLRKIGWDVPGYLLFQVFRGYGETLIGYNQKVSPQFRIGYLFERGQ